MAHKINVLFLITLALQLGACVAPAKSSYVQFAEVGNLYTANLSTLVNVAEEAAIDRASALLIERNNQFSGNDRLTNSFADARQDEYDVNATDIEALLAEFAKIKKHLFLFSRYFATISSYAENAEGEATAAAINNTANSLNILGEELFGQALIPLSADAQSDVGVFTDYVFDLKQRHTLKSRLKKDKDLLDQTLTLHAGLMAALGKGLESDFDTIQDVIGGIEVVRPLISKQPLLTDPDYSALWMARRKGHLVAKLSVAELNQTAKSAEILKQALDGLIERDQNIFVVLDGLVSELQSLKTTLNAIK